MYLSPWTAVDVDSKIFLAICVWIYDVTVILHATYNVALLLVG